MAVFERWLARQEQTEETMDAMSQRVRCRSGSWLAGRRRQLELTEQSVAEHTDIKPSDLEQLEKGFAEEAMFSEEQLRRLIVMLGETAGDIEVVAAVVAVALKKESAAERRSSQHLLEDIQARQEQEEV